MKDLRCYTTKWCRSDYANAVGNTSDNLVSRVIIATSLFLYKGEKSDEPATKPVKITSQERVSIKGKKWVQKGRKDRKRKKTDLAKAAEELSSGRKGREEC